MAVDFVPHGVYEDIINILGKWKVIDMKGLKDFCNYDVKYHNLLKKVRTLESHGLIKSVLLGRKDKHIYLTNKGLKLTSYDLTYEICDENLTHDLVVGRVLRELLTYPSFRDGRMFHQIIVDDIYPDAQIDGKKNSQNYSVALEVELTQKSEVRVKEKFRRYAKDNSFTYAMFISNKEGLYRAYKRYLSEMNPDIQEAVIILFDKSLSTTKFNYQASNCFYMGKERSFNFLFLDTNTQEDELN